MKSSMHPSLQELKHIVHFFWCFLFVLGLFFVARYPVTMERLLPMYSVDLDAGLAQSSLVTVIVFAVALSFFVCFWGKNTLKIWARRRPMTDILAAAGLLLLASTLIASLAHLVLVRVSIRIASGMWVGLTRESADRLARDTIEELRDPATGLYRAYRLATNLLDAESAEEPSTTDLLEGVMRPPLRAQLLMTYTTTVVTFKTGLLFLTFALYRYRPGSRSQSFNDLTRSAPSSS